MQEVDFVCYTMPRKMKFSDNVDYSYPVTMLPYFLWQPWPKEATNKLIAPLKPFRIKVRNSIF